MLSSSANNRLGFWAALVAGGAAAAVFLAFLPFSEINAGLLLVLPFGCVLLLGIIVDPRKMAALLLLTRALLDPVLETTRLGQGGLGLGAGFNLFVILFTVILVFKNARGLKGNALTGRWALFLFFCAASVLYSPFPMKSARFLFALASYLCMAVLPFLFEPEKNDKRFWIKILLAATFLPAMFANLDMVRGGRTYEDAGARILGTFMHPNILAFYLVFSIALVFYVLRSGQFRLGGVKRAALFLYLANLVVLLLATKTRNAWISCWMMFFIYGLIKERKFLVFALLAVACAMALPQVASRASDLSGSSSVRTNSFAWRVELWKSSLPWIRERFFFGYGLATFHDLSRNFFALERVTGADAHNTYVQILFETGIAGLLSYAAIYWGVLRAFFARVWGGVKPLAREYAIAAAYLVTYLLSSVADNMFYYLTLNWYVWFFIGVMLKGTRFHGRIHLRRHPVV